MDKFIIAHEDKITGTISCFDRVLFKGYLPIASPHTMERFLTGQGLLIKDFKHVASSCSDGLKTYAQDVANKAERPYIYLGTPVRKEEGARQIAERDGIEQGLVCVFSTVEACQSFRVKYGKGRPQLAPTSPRCLCLYFYYVDREWGLMHIRIQTWFPFTVQIYINGHEWLARKMRRHGIGYVQLENAFVRIDDCPRAQRFADRFVQKNFARILDAFARKVNPLLRGLLAGMSYYWVVDQAEYATDILFRDRAALKDLYPSLLQHATMCFGAEDVLTFLGRQLSGRFKGEVMNDFKKRWPGARVKHRMKGNWIKMYDKHGCVLRIETVINHPYEFRVRREGTRHGVRVMGWYPMTKGVCNLYRYAQVSLTANRAYLDALSVVDDPSRAYAMLNCICQPVTRNGRRRRGLHPLRKDDQDLFAAALRGENFIHGFRNRDIAHFLGIIPSKDIRERKRQSARVTRLIQLLHAHRLIAKIPRTRRYRLTLRGTALMSAAIRIHQNHFPAAMATQAA